VILDVGMPGMRGRRCLEHFLAFDPQPKVLVASGYATHEHADDLLELGADGFIGKPYQLDELLGKVRHLLDSN
jgi:DNA-binding NarL/FixJ family response regulator